MTQNAVIRITTLSFIFSFRLLVVRGTTFRRRDGDVRNCAAGPRSKASKICEKRTHGLIVLTNSQVSRSSSRNCCFKSRRADFLMARRSAATASFSARRCVRVRISACLGKCKIFGRRAPTFRSFGFAYGFIGVITKHNTSIHRTIL